METITVTDFAALIGRHKSNVSRWFNLPGNQDCWTVIRNNRGQSQRILIKEVALDRWQQYHGQSLHPKTGIKKGKRIKPNDGIDLLKDFGISETEPEPEPPFPESGNPYPVIISLLEYMLLIGQIESRFIDCIEKWISYVKEAEALKGDKRAGFCPFCDQSMFNQDMYDFLWKFQKQVDDNEIEGSNYFER